MNVSAAFAEKLGASHAVVEGSIFTSLTDIIAIAGALIAEIRYAAQL